MRLHFLGSGPTRIRYCEPYTDRRANEEVSVHFSSLEHPPAWKTWVTVMLIFQMVGA